MYSGRSRSRECSAGTANLLLAGLGGLCVRPMGALAAPLTALGAAVWAQGQACGWFNRVEWPLWLEWMLVLVLLDALVWAQHPHRADFQ